MRYLLLISHDEAFLQAEQLAASVHAWDAKMDPRGTRLEGGPLWPAVEEVAVRVRAGDRSPDLSEATRSSRRTARARRRTWVSAYAAARVAVRTPAEQHARRSDATRESGATASGP